MYWSLHYSLPKDFSFPSTPTIWYPEESVILMIGSALLKSVDITRLYECYWYLTNIDDRSFDINLRIPDDLDLDFDFKYAIADAVERFNQQKKLKCELDYELLGFEIKSITDLDFLNELFYQKFELINGDCTYQE
jgi:hypothetical protein